MGSGEEVTAREVRRQVPKEVADAVVELMKDGWTVRTLGHKYRLFCPCGRGGGAFSVGGTVANPGNVARRIRRNRELCPDMHESMK